MKLSREDIGELECRFKYSINCNTSLMTSFEKNEELDHIFGAQICKESNFMRQWMRLHTIINRAYIKTVAAEYLEIKGPDITTWTKGVKEGQKGDVLALFVLCVTTGVHYFVHLKSHNYWTSLKEIPSTHLEYYKGVISTFHTLDRVLLLNTQ